MGLIKDILTKIKTIFSDLRKHLGLLVIITLIWVMLLAGFLFLAIYIGDNFNPDPRFVDFLIGLGFSSTFVNLLTTGVQVLIGAAYILVWLYLWHRLVRMYFWRTAKKYILPSEESTE